MIVSVILPVYNAKNYLSESINSILIQTFTDFELIVIDDGSTDGSTALLQEFAARDSRIRLVCRHNKGLVETLNQALAIANGEFIARMDADDICEPDRFEKQVEFLNENPDVVCVGAQPMLIDGDGRKIMVMKMPLAHAEIDKSHISGHGHAMTHPLAMIRLQTLNAIGGYRIDYEHAEDIDLWLRLGEEGELANLPEVLLNYRQHFSSIGYIERHQQLQSHWRAVDDAMVRRGLLIESTEPHKVDFPSASDVYEKWGWWALQGKNIETSRYYAYKALRVGPWRLSRWRLAACAIRGR